MKKVIARIFIVIGLMCISAVAVWVVKDIEIKKLNDEHKTEVADLKNQHNAEIANIELDTTHAKKQYLLTEDFTAAGLKVNAVYKDGSKAELTTGYTVDSSMFDSNDVDSFSINVSYEGHLKNYVVEVLQPDSVVVEFNDTKGFVGQGLTSLKPVVKAVYNNGGTPIYKTVSKYDNYDFETETEGTKTFKFYAYGKEATTNLQVVSHDDYAEHLVQKLAAHLETETYNSVFVANDKTDSECFIEYLTTNGMYAKLAYDERWIDADGKSYTKSISKDYDAVEDFGSYENALKEEMKADEFSDVIKSLLNSTLNYRTTDFAYDAVNNTVSFEDVNGGVAVVDYETGLLLSYQGIEVLYDYNFEIPSKAGIDFEYQLKIETNKLGAILQGQTINDLNLKAYSVSSLDGTKTDVTSSASFTIEPSSLDVSSEGVYFLTCKYRGREQKITFNVFSEENYIKQVFEMGYAESKKQDVIRYEYIQTDGSGIAYVSDTEFSVCFTESGSQIDVFTDENNQLVSAVDKDGYIYKFANAEDRAKFMFGIACAKDSLLDQIYPNNVEGATCQISATDIIITIIAAGDYVKSYHINKNTMMVYKVQQTDLENPAQSTLSEYEYIAEIPAVDKSELTLDAPGEEYIMAVESGNIYVLTDGTYTQNLTVFHIAADGVATTVPAADYAIIEYETGKYCVYYEGMYSEELYVIKDASFSSAIMYPVTNNKQNLENVYYSTSLNGVKNEMYWANDTFYCKEYDNSGTSYVECWIDATGKVMVAYSTGQYYYIQYASFEDAVRAAMRNSIKERFYNNAMAELEAVWTAYGQVAVNDIVDNVYTTTFNASTSTYTIEVDLNTETLIKSTCQDATDTTILEIKSNVTDFEIPEIPTDVTWTAVSVFPSI